MLAKIQNSFSNAGLLRVSCRMAGSLREVVRHIGKMRFWGRSQNILLCMCRGPRNWMPRRGTGQKFRRELNEKRGLSTKVLHLVRKYRSPNQDHELSVGELNGREIEAGELT